MKETVLARFATQQEAATAVDRLVESGVDRSEVTVLAGEDASQRRPNFGVGAMAGGAFGEYIAHAVQKGGTVVAVHSGAEDVAQRLQRFGGEDIQPIANQSDAQQFRAERDTETDRDISARNDLGPEHVAPSNPRFSSSFDEFAGVFVGSDPVLLAERARSDYEGDTEAIEFGKRMAAAREFAGREWTEAEPDLKAQWAKQRHGDWDRFQSAVHEGWIQARGTG